MGEETIGGYYHLMVVTTGRISSNKQARVSCQEKCDGQRDQSTDKGQRESERVCVAGKHYEATVEGPFSRSRSQGCCRQKSHYVAALFELRESSGRGRVFAFCFYFNGRPLEVGMDWINHKRHIFFFVVQALEEYDQIRI